MCVVWPLLVTTHLVGKWVKFGTGCSTLAKSRFHKFSFVAHVFVEYVCIPIQYYVIGQGSIEKNWDYRKILPSVYLDDRSYDAVSHSVNKSMADDE